MSQAHLFVPRKVGYWTSSEQLRCDVLRGKGNVTGNQNPDRNSQQELSEQGNVHLGFLMSLTGLCSSGRAQVVEAVKVRGIYSFSCEHYHESSFYIRAHFHLDKNLAAFILSS